MLRSATSVSVSVYVSVSECVRQCQGVGACAVRAARVYVSECVYQCQECVRHCQGMHVPMPTLACGGAINM